MASVTKLWHTVTKLFRYKTLERESVTKERERREGRYKRTLQNSLLSKANAVGCDRLKLVADAVTKLF